MNTVRGGDEPGELELDERRPYLGTRPARSAGEAVGLPCLVGKETEDVRSTIRELGVLPKSGLEPENAQHVAGRKERSRTLPQQVVGPGRERRRDLTRHGEDLAAELEGEVGGDERAGPRTRLDDDGGEAETGHDPVPR